MAGHQIAAAKPVKLDEIGDWSVLKLEILKKYASAYSAILHGQHRFHHMYIDGFAGAGHHIIKKTRELVAGSPLNALHIEPPFKELHLIDLDSAKVSELNRLTQQMSHVTVYGGDANKILLSEVFPKVKYEDYRRALCILDPYGMQLDWRVLAAAAKSQTIEIFLNFPIMDMNRNVLLWNGDNADPNDIARMTAIWGDDSWRQACYVETRDLFGGVGYEKQANSQVAEAFRQRLIKVAGFKHVPQPVAMRNKNRAIVYYLFFAAQRPVAGSIVKQIFDGYRNKGLL
ncbi:MAG: uncharacterized protein JWO13_522 [Acidobacteriales bacterium]|nr:uncharacterized protein [Terriglobales bacterium]